jgi:hypothetical protein
MPVSEFDSSCMMDLLPIYYGRLFPLNLIHRWLSYGNGKNNNNKNWTFREYTTLCHSIPSPKILWFWPVLYTALVFQMRSLRTVSFPSPYLETSTSGTSHSRAKRSLARNWREEFLKKLTLGPCSTVDPSWRTLLGNFTPFRKSKNSRESNVHVTYRIQVQLESQLAAGTHLG